MAWKDTLRQWVVLLKIAVFWYVKPYSLISIYRRFGGTYCLHLEHVIRSLLLNVFGFTVHHTWITSQNTAGLLKGWMATPVSSFEVFRVVKSRNPVFGDVIKCPARVVPAVSNKCVNFILKGKVYHEDSSFETSGLTQRRNITPQKTGGPCPVTWQGGTPLTATYVPWNWPG